MDALNDEQLKNWAAGIRNSDEESFDKLFTSLYPRLKHFARGYTRNGEAASDIVQDAFVSLWKHRTNIEPEKSITSYLFMSVRNKALNYIRDYRNKIAHFENGTTEIADSDNYRFEYEYDYGYTDNQQRLDSRADALAVHFKKWINELPSRQKQAFTLSRYDGFDHDEIADIMDISPNTVNNHIVAALEYLKSQYQQYKDNSHD